MQIRMSKLGFHASHEQYPPGELLRYTRAAERAGFRAAMCSDHFHPWLPSQGHSGFAWSWLGSALEATSLSFGTVCCPIARYHPAVIAQAAATLAEMYPDRFWLAIGSGEALNEHITRQAWPDKPQRNQRLREAADIMRALWSGETVTHRGLIEVDRARLYSRPRTAPLLLGAALTPETARWQGSWVDGLITAGSSAEGLRKIIEAFREGGGGDKPIFLQAALALADTNEQALAAAHEQWRMAALKPSQLADLETPEQFEAATASTSPEELRSKLKISADPQFHIDWIGELLELGFERIFLHQVGRDRERFLDLFGQRVLPLFADR
jgi:probable non-F420 flavinoid oxidoreductase